jgi:hypothetical protein
LSKKILAPKILTPFSAFPPIEAVRLSVHTAQALGAGQVSTPILNATTVSASAAAKKHNLLNFKQLHNLAQQ